MIQVSPSKGRLQKDKGNWRVDIRENWNRREQREEIRLRNLLWVSGNILIFQKFLKILSSHFLRIKMIYGFRSFKETNDRIISVNLRPRKMSAQKHAILRLFSFFTLSFMSKDFLCGKIAA